MKTIKIPLDFPIIFFCIGLLVTGSSDWYPQIGGCERPFLRQTVWSKRNEFSNIVYNSGNNRKKRSFNTWLMLGSTYRAVFFFQFQQIWSWIEISVWVLGICHFSPFINKVDQDQYAAQCVSYQLKFPRVKKKLYW